MKILKEKRKDIERIKKFNIENQKKKRKTHIFLLVIVVEVKLKLLKMIWYIMVEKVNTLVVLFVAIIMQN